MPKSLTPALQAYLQSFSPAAGMTLCMADLYTITLQGGSAAGIADGTVLTYTDFHSNVPWNGAVFLANSVLLSGLRYRCTTGVDADAQQITIAARDIDTVGGAPFLQAIAQGLLDGAEIQRERAYFAANFNAPSFAPIGTIVLFLGRVTKVDSIGRTQAKVTLESDLTLLKQQMPRHYFSPGCTWVLYDSGCTLSEAAFSQSGVVGAGSTASLINWNSATPDYAQGKIAFTSGANDGVVVTVKAATDGTLTPVFPLPIAPAVGDTFTASFGCDHTQGTCTSRFNNVANFRGFPFVPPPQIVTGPLATTANAGKG